MTLSKSFHNAVVALGLGTSRNLYRRTLRRRPNKNFGIKENTAFINAFYLSSAIVAVGTVLFAIKFLKAKRIT
ncbi:hypothetical protein KEJ37_02400 [Candidatus Bathyarchaeota archaeon]|nr:hypothetical protein [Candidatus Bathyarchaeota archaeon]